MPRRRLSITAAFLLLGVFAPRAFAGGTPETQPVELLAMHSSVPADWQAQQPESNMRLAQFAVPAAGDGDGVEMVVYYFGPTQGGSVEANVERWQSQFAGPDGGSVEPEITELSTRLGDDFQATLVSLRGSYARGVGMGPSGDALVDRMLLAGIVETPEGKLYPQLHGPAPLVAAQRPAFVGFIEGLTRSPATTGD
ncbi:MAG: hypothetical protein GVY09_11245 [Gammaproteobacteria bacterium]|jgi:hypothetical protein|nr:hypothetical protein [Gammaproteobacteria bacterium]